MQRIILNFQAKEDYDHFLNNIKMDSNQMEGIIINESGEDVEVTFEPYEDNLDPEFNEETDYEELDEDLYNDIDLDEDED